MKRIIPAVIIMLCCLSCRHKGDGHYLLRLRYQKYDKLDVRYHTYTLENYNEDPTTNSIVRLGFTVDSILKDSSYRMAVKIAYAREQTSGILSREYASDEDSASMNPQNRMTHNQLKPLLDSSYHIVINNRGQITQPFSLAGGSTTNESPAPIDFDNFQIVFPAEKVDIGDEWTNETEMPRLHAKRTSTYYIESIYTTADDVKVIQLKLKGTLEMNPGIKQDFTGLYIIDQKTLHLISAKIEMIYKTGFFSKIRTIISIKVNARDDDPDI